MDDRGFHHAYIGIFLMAAGFFFLLSKWNRLGKYRKWICLFVILLGAYIFGDDVYQHFRQLTEPDYRSPLNRLYGRTLWRVAWIRKVNEFVDRMLGGKA